LGAYQLGGCVQMQMAASPTFNLEAVANDFIGQFALVE
jgi:hypothetical protein